MFYVFGISFIYTFTVFLFLYFTYSLQVSYIFMFISFHVHILCMYHILSYLVDFHITYLILSCTFIYILILFIYDTLVCFNLVLFMYYTFICLLLVSSISSFISMTYYILCTITYIISYPVPISCILSCSGYTPMLYFSGTSFSYLYYCILSYYILLSCTFHILSSCTIHILHIHLYVLILSYTLCFRILSVLFLYWLKTNTFI